MIWLFEAPKKRILIDGTENNYNVRPKNAI